MNLDFFYKKNINFNPYPQKSNRLISDRSPIYPISSKYQVFIHSSISYEIMK